ncbi:MAG: aminotransferase class I/II-fold pyridoxal phosphate-dependent enzyme [Barnesiella sp.]|nr:aminotransferase class I/II-fold pyridoxal phosphate-dependent enzyme [Barnesiella sp.]
MVYFDSDYMVGAHPLVLKELIDTNNLHTVGYGKDEFTKNAANLILESCGINNGEVHFLVGGTQTNAVVIDRLLDHNDGVIAPETAHINVHEAGAIESNGHKIITLKSFDGKLKSEDISDYIKNFYSDDTNEFMVRPGMVYISFPTELGTIYTKEEIETIYAVCRRYDIPLFIDGARLAYGLASPKCDISLVELAHNCDVFYIGGTKCGALFGEAIVTKRPELFPQFRSLIKLHGATLAKGRLLGIQFSRLFTDDLYHKIGEHGIKMAMKLKDGFVSKGYPLLIDSPTNQQFFVLPNKKIESLKKIASFEIWGAMGEIETPVRFVTDWSTTDDDINTVLENI